MTATTPNQTLRWLAGLSRQQCMALGCQHKVAGWQDLPDNKLRAALLELPEVTTQAENALVSESPATI